MARLPFTSRVWGTALAVLLAGTLSACESRSHRDETVYTRASGGALGPPPPAVSGPLSGSIATAPAGLPRSPLEASSEDREPSAESGGEGDSARPPRPDEPGPHSAEPATPSAVDGEPQKNNETKPDAQPEPAFAEPSPEGTPALPPEPSDGEGLEPEASAEPNPAPAVEPEPSPAPVAFSKRALLEAIALCSSEHLEEFRVEAALLAEAAATHEVSEDPADLALVQQAWFSAMLSWERDELFQFGPAAMSSEPGGRSLRDQIYAWNGNPPGSHRCRIEQRLVSKGYETPDFASDLVVVRTLSALEFLSFYSGTDTTCTQFDDIVANGSWAALAPSELATRRARYAHVVALGVSDSAEALLSAWPEFASELTAAGNAGALFDSEQSALNAVANALFYLDKAIKDAKLAMPLGLVPECPRSSCPEAFESQYARISTLELYENLNGVRDLFTGCNGESAALGFADWLNALGAEELQTRMQAALDDARDSVARLDPPLEDALLVAPERVIDVHTKVKALTDLLKSEFVTVLNLELPSSVASDTD